MSAWKPSSIISDKVKVSEQYSAIYFPLISCNDLSTISLVAFQLPDTDIWEQHSNRKE